MTEITLTKPSSTPVAPPEDAFATQRANMVDSQVRPSDITDRRIIRAMQTVPREAFLPDNLKSVAYMDNPITLDRSPKRQLVEPRLFAKLVQAAEIPDGGRVLEIGSGCGYGVAVLAAMGLKAFGVEENAALFAEAQQTLSKLGVAAQVADGPFATGLPVEGPFDAIIFAGSVPTVPPALFDQLKNGAKLVVVTGNGPGSKAIVWLRSGMSFSHREAFDATAAPLPGFAPPAQFVF